jgi:uncharacterized membrane protein
MQIDAALFLTIAGMAAVTYITRIGGLVLLRRTRPSRRVQLLLEHLTGALVVSILTPLIVAGGLPEVAAAASTIVVTALTGIVMVGTALGVAVVWLVRMWRQ